ncbi:Inhibitor of growth protein 4 [Trichoplax sp. H2]|nr:Inhibitor of growth protein 4 [Trichoplax sp. H2]|eukprot:RDD44253.1 Inhibitor of growth protein 4 [Trichoplax sp. H2]
MASVLYLEHYLDSIESLPSELQRNFTLMKDLDQKNQDIKGEIDKLTQQYVQEVSNLKSDERQQRLDDINCTYKKSHMICDNKVQLATQTYEMVDKHIRRLDYELARFEADLKEKEQEITDSHTMVENQDIKKNRSRSTGRKKTSRKKLKTSTLETISSAASVIAQSQSIFNARAVDMPVDPNEPTYCLCHQVSYGEMIGCDNTEVLSQMHTIKKEEMICFSYLANECLVWINPCKILISACIK